MALDYMNVHDAIDIVLGVNRRYSDISDPEYLELVKLQLDAYEHGDFELVDQLADLIRAFAERYHHLTPANAIDEVNSILGIGN